MSILKVGLVGCGPMGTSLGTACTEIGEPVSLVGVCDIQPRLAEALGTRLGVRAFADCREMIAAVNPDVGIVATPNDVHREITGILAAAGIHVFCEKPMATAAADCREMISACARHGVKLTIGQVCRYHPVHAKVRELVAGGDFGRPLCMSVHRLGGPIGGVFAQPWRSSYARSGGYLMEINAHEIDFMRWVCGEAESVAASGTRHDGSPVDFADPMAVTIRYRSGAVGILHSSGSSRIGGYGGRVDCEKGSIVFPAFWGEGAGIRVKRGDAEEEFIPASGLHVPPPVREELRVFFDCLRRGDTPPIRGEDGLAAVAIAEAAYISAAEGKVVRLS